LLGSGRVLADKGQHERAAQLYLTALGYAPMYGPLHYAMALSRRALNDTELAQKHLDFAAAAAGGNPDRDELLVALMSLERGVDADYRRAKDLFNQNQFAPCIELVQNILDRQPDHFGALGVLGQCYLRTGQDAEAIIAFEKGLELNPTNLTFLRHHGLLMLRASRFADAEADFRKVMELGVDHPDDHYLFGYALMQVGKLGEARDELTATLDANPSREDARGALIQTIEALLAQNPATEQAEQYVRRLTELKPEEPRYWRSLGAILAELKRPQEAIAALQRSLDLNPEQPDVKFLIEQLQSGSGG
jgi:tetratricopeptide (TPR) repeat protein